MCIRKAFHNASQPTARSWHKDPERIVVSQMKSGECQGCGELSEVRWIVDEHGISFAA
jgi:hypothetical protein